MGSAKLPDRVITGLAMVANCERAGQDLLIVQDDVECADVDAGHLVGIDTQRCTQRESEHAVGRGNAERKWLGGNLRLGRTPDDEGVKPHRLRPALARHGSGCRRYRDPNGLIARAVTGKTGRLTRPASQDNTACGSAGSIWRNGHSTSPIGGRELPEVEILRLDEAQALNHDGSDFSGRCGAFIG